MNKHILYVFHTNSVWVAEERFGLRFIAKSEDELCMKIKDHEKLMAKLDPSYCIEIVW